MNAIRIAAVAVAVAVFGGMQADQAEAGWTIRVEVESESGHVYYPALYSTNDKKDAYIEYAWYEMLMKVYPDKFRTDVLNKIGVPWWYSPVRLHIVYTSGINPTGRP